MKDEIRKEVLSIYDKIQKETAQSLKKYNDGINALEKKSKQSWGLDGIKAGLFWCMCIGMVLFVCRTTTDLFGIDIPNIVWQISYLCALIPLLGYIAVFIIVLIVSIFKKDD